MQFTFTHLTGKMVRTNHDVRVKVILFRIEGLGYRKIVKSMLSEENVIISRKTVRNIIQRFNETGSVDDKKRFGGGRNPSAKLGTVEHMEFVDKCMRDTPDLSARKLKVKIKARFGIDISVSKMNKYRQVLGWKQGTVHYCQMISADNKAKRKLWCEDQLRNGEMFDDVIFTDESRIEVRTTSGRVFKKTGEPLRGHQMAKHPYSVMVWAGISKRGPTSLLIFHGIMKSEFYQDEILEETLLPFIVEKYPDSHCFQQDNDPKHTSRSTAAFMEDRNINWWKTPASSPDLNPIENLWHEMKVYICSEVKPTVKEELIDGLEAFWKTVTVDKCQNYIGHLTKVIPKVIECDGGPSGY